MAAATGGVVRHGGGVRAGLGQRGGVVAPSGARCGVLFIAFPILNTQQISECAFTIIQY